MKTTNTITEPNENPESPLIEGAKILMKGFETSGLFLEFLSEALFWVEHFNNDRKANESAFFLKRMIEEVVQPWIKNGSNVRNEIAEGLQQICTDSGYEGYLEEVSILLQGFAISCKESPYFETKKYLLAFDVLYEVSFCLRAYEYEINKAA